MMNGLQKFIIRLFTLLLVILLTIFAYQFCVGKIFSEDRINEYAKKMDMSTTLENKIDPVFEPVYSLAEQEGINASYVTKMLDTEAMKVFYGKYFNNLIKYYETGESFAITQPEVSTAMTLAVQEVPENELRFTKVEKEQLILLVNQKSGEIAKGLSNIEDREISKAYQSMYKYLKDDYKNKVIIGIIICTIVIVVVSMSTYKWLLPLATGTFISGLLSMITPILLTLLVKSMEAASYSIVMVFTGQVTRQIQLEMIKIGGILIVISIVLFCIYAFIIRTIKEKIAKKARNYLEEKQMGSI